jgi:predicted nucleic acid-binding protein
MFVLDTNILSAMMSIRPVQEVRSWLSRQSPEQLFTTAICQAEILSGIALLPDGSRRLAMHAAAWEMFLEIFDGRILAFDTAAAEAYAEVFALRRRAGRSTPPPDLMIVAVARAHDAIVVTRNVGDFEGRGLTIINPWESPS